MYTCMNVHMYTCMFVHVHAYVPNLYSHINVHIFDMSLNKYGGHIANMSHTPFILHGHIDPAFLHVCQSTTNCNIYFTCFAMYVPATNVTSNATYAN